MASEAQKRWFSENREHVLEQKRQASRIVTEKRRKSVKRYNDLHREERRKSTQEWRARNRDKFRAHGKVAKALRSGKLAKLPCSVCGNPKSQAHHDDYSKPLEVKWLCQTHHKELHRLYP